MKPDFTNLPTTYAELLAWFPPRRLHDDAAYERTMEIIDRMAVMTLNDDQEEYLELLSDMVEGYAEKVAPPMPQPSARDMLKYLMEEHDLNGGDLAGILKIRRAFAYRLLNGQRRLTADHIKALAEYFGVSADLFLGTSGAGRKRPVVAA
jgi:HTH-type transcriptional regulator / antitoxin HigA